MVKVNLPPKLSFKLALVPAKETLILSKIVSKLLTIPLVVASK